MSDNTGWPIPQSADPTLGVMTKMAADAIVSQMLARLTDDAAWCERFKRTVEEAAIEAAKRRVQDIIERRQYGSDDQRLSEVASSAFEAVRAVVAKRVTEDELLVAAIVARVRQAITTDAKIVIGRF